MSKQSTATKGAENTAINFGKEETALSTQNPIEAVPTVPQAPKVTLHDKFERLKAINLKKNYYDEFVHRFDVVKEFRDNHDGGALHLSIKNPSTGKVIEFVNLKMIQDFMENAINQGQEIKENMELEILSLEI